MPHESKSLGLLLDTSIGMLFRQKSYFVYGSTLNHLFVGMYVLVKINLTSRLQQRCVQNAKKSVIYL